MLTDLEQLKLERQASVEFATIMWAEFYTYFADQEADEQI
jgi:hypothetical protein